MLRTLAPCLAFLPFLCSAAALAPQEVVPPSLAEVRKDYEAGMEAMRANVAAKLKEKSPARSVEEGVEQQIRFFKEGVWPPGKLFDEDRKESEKLNRKLNKAYEQRASELQEEHPDQALALVNEGNQWRRINDRSGWNRVEPFPAAAPAAPLSIELPESYRLWLQGAVRGTGRVRLLVPLPDGTQAPLEVLVASERMEVFVTVGPDHLVAPDFGVEDRQEKRSEGKGAVLLAEGCEVTLDLVRWKAAPVEDTPAEVPDEKASQPTKAPKKTSPPPKPKPAVLSALQWLARHQSPSGAWDAGGFSNMCKGGICGGPGNDFNDVGLTGLALLCFLRAGETGTGGAFNDTVTQALDYLQGVQDQDGCFGPRMSQHFMYNHACAALAMAEAYGKTQDEAWRKPGQRGIDFVLSAQNADSAWRYAAPGNGDNDSSVTGWMMAVLKSGITTGLQVDQTAFDGALDYIDKVTDRATGRTGYTSAGQTPSRTPAMMERFPAEHSEALTAVGMVARFSGGQTLESNPLISKGADLLINKPPLWNSDAGTIDFYYWYYGTLAMSQVGGKRRDRWNSALKTALLDNQHDRESEHEYGSWDPIDPWSEEGGRIYATAMNCLSLQIAYR